MKGRLHKVAHMRDLTGAIAILAVSLRTCYVRNALRSELRKPGEPSAFQASPVCEYACLSN